MKKVVLTSNTSWSIWNFRKALMDALLEKGYQVYIIAPEDEYSKKFPNFIPLRNLDRKGTNPVKDFKLLLEYLSIYKNLKPDVVLNFTIKPNIYSSLACRILGIQCISTITGLGYVFVRETFLTKLVRFLYRFSLAKNYRVVFLNPDDLNLFIESSIVNQEKAFIIKGEGVSTEYFNPKFCKDNEKSSFVFLMISRLLWDKGVGEFVTAGKILKRKYGDKVEFWLLGPLDKENPAAVSEEDIKNWIEEGVITYLGVSQDVRSYLCQADCIVLPSYREGIPRSLLEAMAMEKPIITTDSPGCREVCKDGYNGFLVKPKDVESLVKAMEKMLTMEKEKRIEMGKRGRLWVLEEFSEEKIVAKYLQIIQEMGSKSS